MPPIPHKHSLLSSLRLIREYLEGDGTIGDVLRLDAGGGHVTSAMWHGNWSGQIECDLDRAPATHVWVLQRVTGREGLPGCESHDPECLPAAAER
jgi:hypothetical protein